MKVILLSELRGKGGEGDVVDVAQGFAENYLFPNKIAQPATPGNIKQLEERRHNIEKREAERIAALCGGKEARVVSVETRERREQPPRLYDLTALQRDANRLLGYTAQQTLDYAQSLYEKQLLTYPRTDSRYLPQGMTEKARELAAYAAAALPFAAGLSLPCHPRQLAGKVSTGRKPESLCQLIEGIHEQKIRKVQQKQFFHIHLCTLRSLTFTFSRSMVRCSVFSAACSFAWVSRSRMDGFSSRLIFRLANS